MVKYDLIWFRATKVVVDGLWIFLDLLDVPIRKMPSIGKVSICGSRTMVDPMCPWR